MGFIKQEISGWKKWEIAWILIASIIILSVSILSKDPLISSVAAITGVWCVITTGKGKRISFIFGTVNTILYSILAWQASFYGELTLNVLYYIPMNFVGFYFWNKHLNDSNDEVSKKELKFNEKLVFFPLIVFCTIGYGFVLKKFGGASPFIDSMSTVFAVFAQILCTKRCKEQWYLWIIVNITNVVLWTTDCLRGNNSYLMILMWSVYLFNAIIMCVKWTKEAKEKKTL